ncbi:MAG TPA: pyridoxine 5'-phosphate synthase [Polyangiaceae bacterium]
MVRLHVNIDHVATLRNARGTVYPDPVLAAQLCELAGADGITAHLREDRRHIRDDDIVRLRRSLTTLLNLEMAATDEMIAAAERVRPDVVTLVPERREELTTEGGLDVIAARAQVEKVARACRASGIKLSLFIAADLAQIEASRDLGAHQIELHTGEYAEARGAARAETLSRLAQGARHAQKLGLEVAAGHGLTRENVGAITAIPEIEELNIGHAVIADAVMLGISQAVRDLRAAVERGAAARR